MADPFESCWLRLDRARAHRKAATELWNDFIEHNPYDVVLDHHGQGKFVLRAVREERLPPLMGILIGEWLYNLRCVLDYTVYDTAICASGKNPPPGKGVLQFPVYFSEPAYRDNEYRLQPLAEHHRAILESMQPYAHSDADTSAIGWVHKLARIDRHRRLNLVTAYITEISPVVCSPSGSTVEIEFSGNRVTVDHEAELARFTITPWQDDWKVQADPRAGLDPEIAEWNESPFWRPIPYNERVRMLESTVESLIVTFEYDCLGTSRRAEMLLDEFRAECDARRQEWRK